MIGRARAATFGLLVVATFAAFFVVQRLKREPPTIRHVHGMRLFSPNHDGREDGARVSFTLKRGDTITVRVVDGGGSTVRTLVADRPLPAGRRIRLRWNGRDDLGHRAPNGLYRYRVTLQDQGRSVFVPRAIRLDTRPPRPRVTAIGPSPVKPEILPSPDGLPAHISFHTPSPEQPTEVLVYRTDPGAALVDRIVAPPGTSSVDWSPTSAGRPLSAGTYVVAVRTRDRAGNVGSTPPVLPPHPPYGAVLPPGGGITIRYLAAQPSLEPTIAGSQAAFGVDARRRPYRWTLRRVGVLRVEKHGSKTKPVVRFTAPDDGTSGLYLFEVRSGSHATAVPLPVQSVKTHRVLVVLPAILWQGTNPVDDDGDGWPNTLGRGLPVRRDRVFAKGLPYDLVHRVAPLLIFLDRHHLRYDLTTDLALAAGVGPRLDGHQGVILAGDERWLPAAQQLALRRYVRGGGRVATFGVDSLRRQVRLTPRQILDPTAAAPTDAFGATLRPLAHEPGTTLTIFDDAIDLFAGNVYGGTGVFSGYDRYEEVASTGPGTKVVASAVTQDGAKVIVAEQLGKGLIIRFGLPELPGRLGQPGNESELVQRTWALLSR